MTPGPGIEPRTHWWEASALATVPSLLSEKISQIIIYIYAAHWTTPRLKEEYGNVTLSPKWKTCSSHWEILSQWVGIKSTCSFTNRPFPSSLVPLFQSESKCETILMKMTFDLHENETGCRTHFHKNGFALRLVLKQRHKRTRKWPIGIGYIRCIFDGIELSAVLVLIPVWRRLWKILICFVDSYLTTTKNNMMEWMSKLAETDLTVRENTNPYSIYSWHHGQDGGWSTAS